MTTRIRELIIITIIVIVAIEIAIAIIRTIMTSNDNAGENNINSYDDDDG